MARRGSITRKYSTAFTFTDTLSRVMTSCGGTSKTTVRRLTLIIRSIGANTRITPGPLGCGSSFPSRKTTPRSYSARIFTELITYNTTMTMAMSAGEISILETSFSVNGQGQPLHVDDADALVRGDWFRCSRLPDLAPDGHLADAPGLDGRERPAGLTDHPCDTGDGP